MIPDFLVVLLFIVYLVQVFHHILGFVNVSCSNLFC